MAAKTPWHRWLAQLLELLLEPVDIEVQTELPLLSDPPRADIVLLRRRGEAWTPAQRERLADGLRDTKASHLLLEFKYSESLDLDAVRQTLAYDYFYRRRRELGHRELASFVISAKTPTGDWLQRNGYAPTARAGVYRNLIPLVEPVQIILLNELAPTPHNAWFKCFASRRRQVRLAIGVVRGSPLVRQSTDVKKVLAALLRRLMMSPEEILDDDDEEITTEDYRQISDEFLRFVLETTPELVTPELVAQNIGKLSPELVAPHLDKLPPELVAQHLDKLPPELVAQHVVKLTPEQRLAGLAPEERLAGLDEDTILRYLERRRPKDPE
ncbi:MAG: hypothetical protein ACFCBW_03290 [Candidatus Competibacterales bacterium]